MEFDKALNAMKTHKKVTRKAWCLILDEQQMIYIDHTNHICMDTTIDTHEMTQIPSEWILADDWEIIPD